MTIAEMALRNVFRYKKRSMITAAAIAFGVIFSIMIDAMLIGAEVESARNIRDYETGEAKIFAPQYFANRQFLPFDTFLEPDTRHAVESLLDDRRYAPRVLTAAEMVFSEEFFDVAGSVTVKLHAVDPDREAAVFRTPASVESGRWLVPGESGILLGSWLAEDIGARVGHFVTLESQGRGGFYQTVEAEIVGIVLTDNPYVNRANVYMDLGLADELFALDGAVTEYAIRLEGRSDGAQQRTALAAELAPLGAEIYGWEQVEEDAVLLTKTKSGASKIYLVFMFIIAAVGISNTMLMAVMERRSEIGMLRALGYSKIRIRWLFLVEGFGIGLLGTLAGLVIGSLITAFMVQYGVDFSFMMRETDVGYRLTGVMRSAWNPSGMLATVIGALAISSGVAWFPSGRILRSEVADILRR